MWEFNMQSSLRWFINKVKKAILALIIHSFFYTAFLVWIMEYWKDNRMAKMSLIIATVYMIVHITFPNLIMSFFDKQEDSSKVNKAQRTAIMKKIEAEVKKSGISVSEIKFVDASKASSQS